jgi:hypothetical protein
MRKLTEDRQWAKLERIVRLAEALGEAWSANHGRRRFW